MSQPSSSSTGASPATSRPGSTGSAGGAGQEVAKLKSDQGTTTIADVVVSKIAGLAAKEVSGVYALGGGAARAFGALRQRIPGGSVNHSQGISVEVGERQAAVDIDLIAEYGVSISDLAAGIRRNVIQTLQQMTGLEVTEVNIDVNDIHVPGEEQDDADDEEPAQPAARRVQ